ncbi:MAG TPA: hypothetical protein VH394_06900 [Thermoanaerobaculia bacterium]|nr:hypothetical protein [Thermoanaerobaculia bacterium]
MKRDKEEEERARLDERWDRLSAGELSPEEEAELRALAESSEEAREDYEAFRPLGPDFHARVVNAIRAEQKAAEPQPRVLPFRPARIGGWLTAAAAAAAVLVVLLRPPTPLPDYAPPDLSGGTKAARGEETQTGVFAPGDPIHVVLRPETEVSKVGDLEARCVLVRDGEARVLDLQSIFDPGGSVRMDGFLDAGIPAGAWTLWAVVGRPGKLPEPAELRALAAAEVRRDDWTAVPATIRIRASPR